MMCRGMLGEEGAALPLTVEDLRQVGVKLFFNSLSCYASALLDMVIHHLIVWGIKYVKEPLF